MTTQQTKKDTIADAALSCFLRKGYGGTSMDDIVKAAGTSKGGIYWHFKSKDDVFLFLLERDMERDKDKFNTMLEKYQTAKEQLIAYLDCCVEKALGSPMFVLVGEFMSRAKSQEVMDRLNEIFSKKHTGSYIVHSILQRGVDSGEFHQMDLPVMTELFCSLTEGMLGRYYIFHKDSALLEKALTAVKDIFINNLYKNTVVSYSTVQQDAAD